MKTFIITTIVLLTIVVIPDAIGVMYIQDRGQVATGSFEWNPQNFNGFYYDINDDTGTERLITVITNDNELSGAPPYGLIYETQAQIKDFKFKDWGSYNVIGFIGKMCFAGYTKNNYLDKNVFLHESGNNSFLFGQIEKVLIDFNEELLLHPDNSLWLEEGYELAIGSNSTNETIIVRLLKEGNIVDTQSIYFHPDDLRNNTYYYKKDIARQKDLTTIAVHLKNLGLDSDGNIQVIVDGIWQISEMPIDIDPGTVYGNMTILKADYSNMKITMGNVDNSIRLKRDISINIFGSEQSKSSEHTPLNESVSLGDINLRTAKSEILKYYLYKEYAQPGVYEVRGSVAEGDFSWTPENFAGFYYDLDNGIGTERLTVALKDEVKPGVGYYDILYETQAQLKDFMFNDWGSYYVIGFLGNRFFAGYFENKESEYRNLLFLESEDANSIRMDQLEQILLDDNSHIIFDGGAQLELREGYRLHIAEIDLNGEKVLLRLTKNGNVIDSKVVRISSNNLEASTYCYRENVGLQDDLVIIAVHFSSIFSGEDGRRYVLIDGIWQISDMPIYINECCVTGTIDTQKINFEKISIKSNVMLENGTDIHLMGKYRIKAAEQDVITKNSPLRFYVHTNRTIADLIINKNTIPIIISANIDVNPSSIVPKGGNNYTIFKRSELRLSCTVHDAETLAENLKVEWLYNNNLLSDERNSTVILGPGTYDDIKLRVTDSEGAYAEKTMNNSITVISRTEQEYNYFRDIKRPFIIFLMALLVIFGMFKNSFGRIQVAITFASSIVVIYAILNLISYSSNPDLHGLCNMRDAGIVQLFLLAFIIPFANYFIVSSFPRCNKHKNLIDRIVNLISDSWYLTMSIMFIIIYILVWVIPKLSDFDDMSLDVKYNYIFWYYSMMAQAFGAILAIVAMVATTVSERIDQLGVIKIKNFVKLYILIILLSISGLVTRSVPHLQPSELVSYYEILPLLFFELSLLLSVPALVCLAELIFDFINLNHIDVSENDKSNSEYETLKED